MRKTWMSMLLGLAVVVVILGSILHFSLTKKRNPEMTQLDTTKQINNCIHLGALMVWPLLYFIICSSSNLNIKDHPYIILGLIWPVILILAKMCSLADGSKETAQESHVRHSETRGSAGLLFTAAFGVGVLLTALRKTSSDLGTKLVLLSLLFCVAFLIPVTTSSVENHTSHIIRTLQTCVTHMAIGIFILGITVSYFDPQNVKLPEILPTDNQPIEENPEVKNKI